MNLFKTILITSIIVLPLGFYLARLYPQSPALELQYQYDTPHIATSAIAVKSNDERNQDDDLTLLKTEMIDLKADLTALRAELHNSNKIVANAKIVLKPTVSTSVSSDKDIQLQEEQRFAKQGEAVEADFRQQAIDSHWAAMAEALIKESLISDKITEAAIISLECRTHSCRLELANNTKNETPEFIKFTQHIAGVLTDVMVSQIEGGTDTTVFYLSKNAFALPQL